jgi:hypothetical protein
LRDGTQRGIDGDVVLASRIAECAGADIASTTFAGSDGSATAGRGVFRGQCQIEIGRRNQGIRIEVAVLLFFFTR